MKTLICILFVVILSGCGGTPVDNTISDPVEEVVVDNHVKFYIDSITHEGDAVAIHDYKDYEFIVLIEFLSHDEIMAKYYTEVTPESQPVYGLALGSGAVTRIYIEEWESWEGYFQLYVFGHEVRHCMEAGIGQVVHLN